MTATAAASTAAGVLTATSLAGVGAVHVVWARGSTFPFATSAQLHDAVVGRDASPSAGACYAVAAALGIAAVSVGRAATGGGPLARATAGIVAVVLGVRAVSGLVGRTDLLVPGSTSATFRRLDRRLFSPFCAVLASGAAASALSH